MKNKENLVGKHTFWTEMKFTENLNPRNFKYVTHIALNAMCEEILNSEFLVVMAAVQKKVELELSLEKSTFPRDK